MFSTSRCRGERGARTGRGRGCRSGNKGVLVGIAESTKLLSCKEVLSLNLVELLGSTRGGASKMDSIDMMGVSSSDSVCVARDSVVNELVDRHD